MGSMSFISAFLIVSPRVFLEPKNQQQEKAVDMIQAGIVFALVIGALGTLGLYQLYKVNFQFDKFVHFANSFIFSIVIIRSCEGWRGFSFGRSIFLAVTIIFLGGIAWEIYEFLGDNLFGTQMLGHYGEFITHDTIWDLIMNGLGMISGVLSLYFFENK